MLQDPGAVEDLKKQQNPKKRDKEEVKKARRVILKRGREALQGMLKTQSHLSSFDK